MALADSGRAIGAVTRLLQDHLIRRGFDVSIGKPEEAAANDTRAKLNLFLYETGFDSGLRNVRLRPNEPEPLWLVLKYLLTAFDADENSDSPAAHDLLGRGISALHQLNFLSLDGLVALDVRLALENNPEPLKLTFDETTADLLSKIMQGTDERYRLSVAFQMRPVMIVPGTDPRYSLLVGVDYTTAPETIIGERGVRIDVQPTLGPSLDRVEPAAFEAGEQIVIFGDDLNGADLEVVLGSTVLTVVSRRPDRITAVVEGSPGTPIASGTAISAGEHPLVVRRRLSATRTRSSNLLAARLLPTVSGAALAAGDMQVSGVLLGTENDDIVAAFYQDGRTVRLFDIVTAAASQQTLTFADVATAVPAGTYRVVLIVNRQQAIASPAVVVP
jgi:Pvc16 N-terminal domain